MHHFRVSSLCLAALASLAVPAFASDGENWSVLAQTLEPEAFESCQHCSFVTADGGAMLVGRNSYSQGLAIVRYAPSGAQLWTYENAGNFKYPQGPQAAAFLEDGSTCVLTQNLLADQQNTVSAIRLDPNGHIVWQTASLGVAIDPLLATGGVIACTPDGGAAVGRYGSVIRIDAAGIVRWTQPLEASANSAYVKSLAARADSSVLGTGFLVLGQGSSTQYASDTTSFAVDGTTEWRIRDAAQSNSGGGEDLYVAADGSIRFVRQLQVAGTPQLRVSAAARNGSIAWDRSVAFSQAPGVTVGALLQSRFAVAAYRIDLQRYRLLEFDAAGQIVHDESPAPLANANITSIPVVADGGADGVLVAQAGRTSNNAYLAQVRRLDAAGNETLRRDLGSADGPWIDAVRWQANGASATAIGAGYHAPIGFRVALDAPDVTLFDELTAPASTWTVAMAPATDGWLVLYGSATQERFAKYNSRGALLWQSTSADTAFEGSAQVVALPDGGGVRIWLTHSQQNPMSVLHAERIDTHGSSLWRDDVPAGDAQYSTLVAAWLRANGNIDAVLDDGLRIDVTPDGANVQQTFLPIPLPAKTLFVQNVSGKPWAVLASGIANPSGTTSCWMAAFDRDGGGLAATSYACPVAADANSVLQTEFSVASFDGTSFTAALNPTPLGMTNQIQVLRFDLSGNVQGNTNVTLGYGRQHLSAGNGYLFLSLDTYPYTTAAGALLREDGTLLWQEDLTAVVGANLRGAPAADGSVIGTAIDSATSRLNVFSLDVLGAVRFLESLPGGGKGDFQLQRFGTLVLGPNQIALGTGTIDTAEKFQAVFGVFGDVIFADGFEP